MRAGQLVAMAAHDGRGLSHVFSAAYFEIRSERYNHDGTFQFYRTAAFVFSDCSGYLHESEKHGERTMDGQEVATPEALCACA